MSDCTQLRARGPYSIASAIIGARLNIDQSRGDEHAKLLWFVVLSHTHWRGRRPAWATDTTLAHESGLGRRDVERGLARLRIAGLLSTPQGHRPGSPRPHGRLLVPRLGAPVKVVIPDRDQMADLWSLCREVNTRPAALVTLAVGLYVIASHVAGGRPSSKTEIPGPLADVRRFVGARKGHAWTKRVRDLERIGLLSRDGLAFEAPGDWPAPGGDPRWARADQSWP